jgi:hypothetical protein
MSVAYNWTGELLTDTYGNPWPKHAARVRTAPCKCLIPCAQYVCSACGERRPWCCGGSPDPRCDFCVCPEAS